MSSGNTMKYAEFGVVAALGAAAAGSFVSGGSFTDVLTAANGGLGAGIGAALSLPIGMQLFLKPATTMTDYNKEIKEIKMVFYASPFVIPLLMDMSLDQTTLAVGAGGAGALYLYEMYKNKN